MRGKNAYCGAQWRINTVGCHYWNITGGACGAELGGARREEQAKSVGARRCLTRQSDSDRLRTGCREEKQNRRGPGCTEAPAGSWIRRGERRLHRKVGDVVLLER